MDQPQSLKAPSGRGTGRLGRLLGNFVDFGCLALYFKGPTQSADLHRNTSLIFCLDGGRKRLCVKFLSNFDLATKDTCNFVYTFGRTYTRRLWCLLTPGDRLCCNWWSAVRSVRLPKRVWPLQRRRKKTPAGIFCGRYGDILQPRVTAALKEVLRWLHVTPSELAWQLLYTTLYLWCVLLEGLLAWIIIRWLLMENVYCSSWKVLFSARKLISPMSCDSRCRGRPVSRLLSWHQNHGYLNTGWTGTHFGSTH